MSTESERSDHPFSDLRLVESFVDRQIQEAVERGEFDDLPGTGRPLASVESYDPDWWAKGFIRRERAREAADDLRRAVRRELPGLRAGDRDRAAARVGELNAQIEMVNEHLAPTDRIDPITL